MLGPVRFVGRLSWIFDWIAGWAMVGMMLLTCSDVVLRLFRKPILGTYEVVGFLGAVVISFAMAQTTIDRAHVAVQVFVIKLSPAGRKAIFLITSLLSLGLFATIAFESFRFGNDLRRAGEVSLTLQLPFFPILYGIGFSAAIVCIICLIDFFQVATNKAKPWYKWKA
jgi:TRAP-type C4-dicarboxylate transport system permease small subunit